MNDKISIIILTHNAPKYVRLTLASLKKYTKGNYEVLVLDNASKRPTRTLLKLLLRLGYIGKLVMSSHNTLFAGGNNILAAIADQDSKYFLLLNSDVEIKSSEWLTNLLKIHKKNKAGITTYGVVDTEPKRVDGYCYLIDADLYRKFPLDESYQWYWGITKQQAKVLNDGHIVQGVKDHEQYLHHFGGKSGDSFIGAKGMDTPQTKSKKWFNGKKPKFL
ncbi:glycosyltransferase [Christensenellaceae bacterium OttesenSCG-928-L17]|nr:glycosyltransferase [Christensenellaceae bacterium OttesenSCG-928-L17]